jgi:hypothetical protein
LLQQQPVGCARPRVGKPLCTARLERFYLPGQVRRFRQYACRPRQYVWRRRQYVWRRRQYAWRLFPLDTAHMQALAVGQAQFRLRW